MNLRECGSFWVCARARARVRDLDTRALGHALSDRFKIRLDWVKAAVFLRRMRVPCRRRRRHPPVRLDQ